MTPKDNLISRRQFLKRTAIAAAALTAVPESITSAHPFRTDNATPNWYVDSAHGADTNDGKSPKTAFATIGKLLSQNLQAAQTIGLAAGSYWREMLRVDVPNITITAYGDGPKPILDASDVIPDTAWMQTAGKRALFQATVSPHFDEPTVWVNVWENGLFLPRAADVNQCATMPGTCFVSSDSVAPVTIYVHSGDESSPANNHKVYEFSARLYGIDLYNSENGSIKGLQTQKNLHNNGSTALGHFGSAIDCTFLDGSKHNVYGRAGVSFTNCLAKNHYYNQDSTMFVYQETTPHLEPISFTGCTASNDVYDETSTGFFGHSFNGNFGEIHYTNCQVSGCGAGFVDNGGSSMVFDACHVENATAAWALYTIQSPYLLRQCVIQNCQTALAVRTEEVKVTAIGLQVCGLGGKTDSGGLVEIPYNKADFTFEACVFASATPSNIIYATGNGPLSLNIKNSQFIEAAANLYIVGPQLTLVSDNNCFQGNGTFVLGTKTYTALNAYQAATGQDAHSSAGNCSGGCA